MRIYLFEDEGPRLKHFQRLNEEMVRDQLVQLNSDDAKAFLESSQNITFHSIQIESFANYKEQVDLALRESEDEPTIFLMDIRIGGNDPGEDVVPVFERIGQHPSLVVGLATSFADSDLLDLLEAKYPDALDPLAPADLRLKDCGSVKKALDNVVKTILLWQQKKVKRYKRFLEGLMACEPCRNHPKDGADGSEKRRVIFKNSYPTLYKLLPEAFVDRQLYEISSHDNEEGLGLECAWLLAILVAFEMYPNEYTKAFKIDEVKSLIERDTRSRDRPFIPGQSLDDRLRTLLLFCQLCEVLFKHKARRTFELESCDIEVEQGSVRKLHLCLKWDPKSLPDNVKKVFAKMNSLLLDPYRSITKKKNDAATAIVAFLNQTTQCLEANETHFLTGSCTNVFLHCTQGRARLSFED